MVAVMAALGVFFFSNHHLGVSLLQGDVVLT